MYKLLLGYLTLRMLLLWFSHCWEWKVQFFLTSVIRPRIRLLGCAVLLLLWFSQCGEWKVQFFLTRIRLLGCTVKLSIDQPIFSHVIPLLFFIEVHNSMFTGVITLSIFSQPVLPVWIYIFQYHLLH
jgi:hypothetical protein